MNIASLDDIKKFLAVTVDEFDEFLSLQAEVMTEAIEGYCGRKFHQGSYTQTFYRDEIDTITKELFLYHYPLISVQSITPVDFNGNELDAITNFRKDIEVGSIIREWPNYWFLEGEKIKVSFSAGYAKIPAPVRSVFFSLIQEKYNRKVQGLDLNFGTDIQRVSIPGALSIDFDYTLDSNQRVNAFGNIIGNYLNILDPYRSERVITGRMGRIYVE